MKVTFSFRRYNLRFLFAAVSVAAIALAFVVKATSELNSIARDHQQLKSVINAAHPAMARQGVQDNGHSSIVASPKSGGFAMVTFEPVPRWLVPFAMLTSHDTYPQVTEIQLVAPGFDDSQLRALAAIGTLKSIDFDQTQVTDAGLSEFCKKSNVEHIQVGNQNKNVTESGRRLAARMTSEHDYTPKWPPPS
jgi:hypothetical protein